MNENNPNVQQNANQSTTSLSGEKVKKVIKVRKPNYVSILGIIFAVGSIQLGQILKIFVSWIATLATGTQTNIVSQIIETPDAMVMALPFAAVGLILCFVSFFFAKRRGGLALGIIGLIVALFVISVGGYNCPSAFSKILELVSSGIGGGTADPSTIAPLQALLIL